MSGGSNMDSLPAASRVGTPDHLPFAAFIAAFPSGYHRRPIVAACEVHRSRRHGEDLRWRQDQIHRGLHQRRHREGAETLTGPNQLVFGPLRLAACSARPAGCARPNRYTTSSSG